MDAHSAIGAALEPIGPNVHRDTHLD